MAAETPPNQSATGDVPSEGVGAGAPTPPPRVEAPAPGPDPINQGAPGQAPAENAPPPVGPGGTRPYEPSTASDAGDSESPLSVDSQGGGMLEERPELAVGAAFAGGLALAVVLRLLSGGED